MGGPLVKWVEVVGKGWGGVWGVWAEEGWIGPSRAIIGTITASFVPLCIDVIRKLFTSQ